MKNDEIDNAHLLMNETEAAAFIGASPSQMRLARFFGEMWVGVPGPIFIRAGRAIRYHRSDLEIWLSALPRFTSNADVKTRRGRVMNVPSGSQKEWAEVIKQHSRRELRRRFPDCQDVVISLAAAALAGAKIPAGGIPHSELQIVRDFFARVFPAGEWGAPLCSPHSVALTVAVDLYRKMAGPMLGGVNPQGAKSPTEPVDDLVGLPLGVIV
jgi:hypothetical protein